MDNRFKNGYVCEECYKAGNRNRNSMHDIPVYLRINGKFIFDGSVKCPDHELNYVFKKAIALRDIPDDRSNMTAIDNVMLML